MFNFPKKNVARTVKKKKRNANFYIETFFMLCIFIEIQAYENKRMCISGCLKILNTISRKKRLKKLNVFFYLKIQKKFQNNLFF